MVVVKVTAPRSDRIAVSSLLLESNGGGKSDKVRVLGRAVTLRSTDGVCARRAGGLDNR